MTSVLVLGGTGWLSGRVAEAWRDRGAEVVALARGGRPAPAGVSLVVADRDADDAYAEVSTRDWDEIVDITMNVAHARAAVDALAGRAAHWTCVSTISVYADTETVDADESAATVEPADPDSPSPVEEGYDYGRAKVAIEDAVRAGLGARALVVRPGLIVGPGDPTDRFGYWVARFALAGAEPVLVPRDRGSGAQVIDVRDLAAFLVDAAARGTVGTVDAVGDAVSLDDTLVRARAAAGHSGELVERDEQWLSDRGVGYWSGPRSLPLWLPADSAGLASRCNVRFHAAGGVLRPLADTLADTLADERLRGLDRERRSGLGRDEERDLLSEDATSST